MNDRDWTRLGDMVLANARAAHGAPPNAPIYINRIQWQKFVEVFGIEWTQKNCRLIKPIETTP